MAGYALRRLLGAIPTLFIIVTLTFFMMHAAPGGPFDAQRRLPPEVEANVKAAYDLDKPLWQQYTIYLTKLAHGDLGPSFKNKDFTVAQLIGAGLPVSVTLGLSAMALALLLGTALGVTYDAGSPYTPFAQLTEAQVVGWSAVQRASLTATGSPASAPSGAPDRKSVV